MEWISVKERLPEVFVKVLICGSNKEIAISCRMKSGIFDVYPIGYDGEVEVTHWMPLPEPPK